MSCNVLNLLRDSKPFSTRRKLKSEVLSELHQLKMSEEECATTEGFVERIHEKIKTASNKIRNGSEKKITRIYEYEDIFVSDIQSCSDNKVKLTKIDFSYKIVNIINDLMEKGKFRQDLFSELNSIFLQRLIEKVSTIRKSALVIPIRFSMVKTNNRDHIENILKSMDEKYQKLVIIERIQLPSRLSVVADEMRPFSVGSQIQMAELRGASQVKNFNLRQNRIGMISMDYEDVVYSYNKGIGDVVNHFRNFGGRLYIKNIPEGKLVDVQEYKPDLIGIRT